MTPNRNRFRKAIALTCLFALLLGLSPTLPSVELTVHILALQTPNSGSCTYVQCGDTDILIDAGVTAADRPAIEQYLCSHMQDNHLDYVIVSHAHADHYAGFAAEPYERSLLDAFSVGTLIDFSQVNAESQDAVYHNYVRERAEAMAKGTRHRTAKECIDQKESVFDLGNGAVLEILDSYFYHTPDPDNENNHSVCCLISQGESTFLYTGDLESIGEQQLILKNDLPKITLYQVGHHGSDTSSSSALLSVIRPKIAAVNCCAGSREYTGNPQNQFPHSHVVDRLLTYTRQIYVTSSSTNDAAKKVYPLNGTVQVHLSTAAVTCTGDPHPFPETDWYRRYRLTSRIGAK